MAVVAASCSGTSSGGQGSGARPPTVRSLGFPGPFLTQDVVASGGKIWLVGAVASIAANTCAVERVDPTTLRTTTYPLAACGGYVAVGGGMIFLVVARYVTGTNNEELHIESFDTATGRSTVMTPVVTAGQIGSGFAHMAFTYGDGSLWLYPWITQLWRISPSTGAVVDTLSGVPEAGGGQPAVMVDSAGIWLAEGPGGGPVISRIPPGSRTPIQVYSAGIGGSILWLAALNGRVWADAATFSNEGRTVRTRLVALDHTGRKVVESGPECWSWPGPHCAPGRRRACAAPMSMSWVGACGC